MFAPESVKGFLLAAGFGQRMLPLTEAVPKPMLPIGAIPLAGYNLSMLAAAGIDTCLINLHHLGHVIRQGLADGADYGVKLHYSEEAEILGTGGGIRKLHGQIDRTVLLLNSDTLLNLDIASFVAQHRASGALVTLLLRPAPAGTDLARIGCDSSGRIWRILGKGPSVAGPLQHWMYTGVSLIEPRFLSYLPPNVYTCYIRYGLTHALEQLEHLHAVIQTEEDYFLDAGTPLGYWQANQDLLHNRLPLTYINALRSYQFQSNPSPNTMIGLGSGGGFSQARLRSPVLIGDYVTLEQDCIVGPQVIIGRDAHIGTGSLIEQSIVLPNVRLAAQQQVQGYLLGPTGGMPWGQAGHLGPRLVPSADKSTA